MSTPLDAVAAGLGAVGAVAHALDKPDDVDRAAFVGKAAGRLAWAIDVYRRAKHPGRKREAMVVGSRWAAALRNLGEPLPVLPWDAA